MPDQNVTSETSPVWGNHVTAPDTPEGFTFRTTYPTNPDGVEVMLERWKAGTEEPPHFHPGDDMTVVVEGKMSLQFYKKEATGLVPDGDRVFLHKGETGYVRAGRIHDAQYLEDCKLVYVHNRAFGFQSVLVFSKTALFFLSVTDRADRTGFLGDDSIRDSLEIDRRREQVTLLSLAASPL